MKLTIGRQISKYVNESEGTDIDFVIMGENSSRYQKIEDCPAGEVLNNVLANVLFMK